MKNSPRVVTLTEVENLVLGTLAQCLSHTSTHHDSLNIPYLLRHSSFKFPPTFHDTLSEFEAYIGVDWEHLLTMLYHKYFAPKYVRISDHYEPQRGLGNPGAHCLTALHQLQLLLKHLGFDVLENLPFMQLEQTILLVELLPFLLVEYGNFLEHFSLLSIYFYLHLLFCPVKAHSFCVFLFQVFARPLFL